MGFGELEISKNHFIQLNAVQTEKNQKVQKQKRKNKKTPIKLCMPQTAGQVSVGKTYILNTLSISDKMVTVTTVHRKTQNLYFRKRQNMQACKQTQPTSFIIISTSKKPHQFSQEHGKPLLSTSSS